MTALTDIPPARHLSSLITIVGEPASIRFMEFFAANIRNVHTGRAYPQAMTDFLAWCEDVGVRSITQVQPLHVAGWIELQDLERSAPTAKLRLAAVRHLFDWLVIGQVVSVNPAASVRGSRQIVKSGKTPALEPGEARAAGEHRHHDAGGPKRPDADRADGLFVRADRRGDGDEGRGGFYAEAIAAYIDGAGLADDSKAPILRTVGRGTGRLTRSPLPQGNAYAMIARRSAAADIATTVGNHRFWTTGITAYLKNAAPWRSRRNGEPCIVSDDSAL